MKSCVTKNQKKQSKTPKKNLTSTEDEDLESSSEIPYNSKLTTCPLHLFGPPASRVAPLNDEDCMLFKHLLALHRSEQDPALYFKWGIWKTSAESQVPNLEDIVETEVQLITWNKQIQKSSVPGEVAYLRLGLHPDRRCGKLAFQVSFDQAKDFFVQVARIVLQEEISMPMEIHLPVIGVDLNEIPSEYALMKLWLGPKLNTGTPILRQIYNLLEKLRDMLSQEFSVSLNTAVYVHENGHTVAINKE